MSWIISIVSIKKKPARTFVRTYAKHDERESTCVSALQRTVDVATVAEDKEIAHTRTRSPGTTP